MASSVGFSVPCELALPITKLTLVIKVGVLSEKWLAYVSSPVNTIQMTAFKTVLIARAPSLTSITRTP